MYRNTSREPHPAAGGDRITALVPAAPPRARRGPRVHRRARSESGQAFVELAFLLPVLFLLAMGILDFGRVFYAYEAVINSAREGARYCGLHSRDDTSVVTNTQTQVTTELSNTVTTPTVSGCAYNLQKGTAVTVTVDSSVPLVTPLVLKMSSPFPIRAQATMVVW